MYFNVYLLPSDHVHVFNKKINTQRTTAPLPNQESGTGRAGPPLNISISVSTRACHYRGEAIRAKAGFDSKTESSNQKFAVQVFRRTISRRIRSASTCEDNHIVVVTLM